MAESLATYIKIDRKGRNGLITPDFPGAMEVVCRSCKAVCTAYKPKDHDHLIVLALWSKFLAQCNPRLDNQNVSTRTSE